MFRAFKALDRVLRGEATQLPALREGTIEIPSGTLTGVLIVLGMIAGACTGLFAVITRYSVDPATAVQGWEQLFASTVKVPLLFCLTLLVTFPSLYVFNALVGSRLTFGAVVRLLVAALGVMLALQASFGTIVVFFSVSTTSYPFMVLLNVVLFAISGFLGLGFLLQTLHRLSLVRGIAEPVEPTPPTPQIFTGDEPPVPAPPGALDRVQSRPDQSVKNVFRIWVIVFGLVGAQMGWVLRPFVGHPKADFTFFRERKENFFQAVVTKVGELFEWDSKGGRR